MGARGPMSTFASNKNREGVLIRLRTVLASLLLVAAVLGAAVWALTCAQPKAQAVPASASAPSVPVVGEPVKSGEVPIYLRGIGTVQAYNTDTIRAQAP